MMSIYNKMYKEACIWYSLLLVIIFLTSACVQQATEAAPVDHSTWAEKLGFPAGKKVIIFHADDMGMVEEANAATIFLLENNLIQSAAAMAPCPAYEDAIKWAINNPDADVGIHLTLTSEWRTHRWGTVTDPEQVPGLIDPDGYMWRSVREVVMNASPEEVEKELKAQIEKTLALGYRPTHMDTHMGTLYASNDFTEIYLGLAEEYRIPAMVVDFSDSTVLERYKHSGYPITDRLLELIGNYSLPKLDNFTSVPSGKSYEEVRQKFFELIRSLGPGLTEIIFHPQFESEYGKTITNSWQQRAWETELFDDPEVKQFFKDEGLIFTNWKEIMKRFESTL
jgi:chitin disaccharide deacetylase